MDISTYAGASPPRTLFTRKWTRQEVATPSAAQIVSLSLQEGHQALLPQEGHVINVAPPQVKVSGCFAAIARLD